jgi:hypothetical protein
MILNWIVKLKINKTFIEKTTKKNWWLNWKSNMWQVVIGLWDLTQIKFL